jgi:polyphosphate kinase
MVELKARFDEENNITWAKALEAQGVHVVYGLVGLKTHAKIALVVRREGSLLRRYIHMSTGNYNASTARIYSDLGFYSCREDLAEDITQLFNRITGFAPKATYRKLLVAPEGLRDGLMRLFDREIEHANAGRPARMIIKANAITDAKCIRKLYEASRAGVQIDMIIRGISRLRPGIPGVSDNIHVRSIVGRFLEHSRVYWFANGGNGEVYLGSADLMERNLDRRVEQLFPVEDARLKRFLYSMVTLQLRDNVGTRVLQPDGSYIWLEPGPDEEPIDAQQILLENRHDLLNLPLIE